MSNIYKLGFASFGTRQHTPYANNSDSTATSIVAFTTSFISKCLLVLLLIVACSVDGFATHFRGGNITWQQAGGNKIQFNLNSTWRKNYPFTYQAGSLQLPVVGAVVFIGTITYGDNTTETIYATINSVDIAANFVNTTWTKTHTYATAGNFNVSALNECCTLSSLRDGNNDINYMLQTIVNVGAPFNSPPVSALPVEYGLSTGQQFATFTIPYTDPNGDAVTFRVATQAESGLVKPLPTGCTLSSAGVITFDTRGLTVGNLYVVQVMMLDGKTKIPIEFIIEIVPFSQPPVFVSPTPLSPNNVFNVLPGNTVSFSLAADDPDVGQFVTLTPVSVPLGSTMSPALPTVGPIDGTVTSTFSWTPTPSQVGTKVITFTALDDVGVQSFIPITINVLCPLSITVSANTPVSCVGSSDGAASITVQGASSTANLSFAWTYPSGFLATTPNIANVAAGTYSVRVSDNANGCITNNIPVVIGTTPDVTPPTITCPADIPCVEATSPAGAVVTYPSPTATDNCSTPQVNSVLPSGSTFPVGTSTVVATATDASGNSASCSFTVEVCDRTPPVIHNCPNNIPCVEATSPAGAVVTYPSATATDIVDGTVSVVSVPASGSTFPLGTTTVISTATDAHGNSASCSFTVQVCDLTPPVITCPANIPCVEATSPAGAVVTYPSATATDNADAAVSAFSVPASGSTLPIGTSTIVAVAIDAHGNATSCSFTVTVCDLTPPVITCPANIPCVEATSPSGAVVSYPPVTATDAVGVVSTFSSPISGSAFPIGTTTITATALDANSNASSCTFTIKVCDTRPPIINCPNAISVSADAGICGAVVTFNTPTTYDDFGFGGPPSSINPNALPRVTQTGGLASGATFPVGVSTVTFTSTDASGNSTSCSFTVTVTDNQKPVITCPTPLSKNTDLGVCGALTTFGSATATDNCSATVTQTGGLANGAIFPVGVSTITFTATDAAGNTASCSSTVIVTDNEKPVVTCPQPIQVSNTVGSCSAVVNFTVSATDNCVFTANLTGLASGSTFPVGTTTNTFTATDASGNTAACSFTVKVMDTEKPIVTCPQPIQVNNTVGSCSAVVNFTVSATDNCAFTANLTGLASGSNFPVGTTTNTFTATDASGNTAACSFTVKVIDTEKPKITAPANVISCVGTGIVLGTPTTSDNCGVQSVSNNAPSSFPNGVTTVVWTVTDVNGNSATATQTVSVLPVTSLTPSVINNVCNGGNNGQVSLTVAGGTSPFTFSRSGSATTNTTGIFTGLTAGSYGFTVTDKNGCSKTATATVTQPTAIVFGTPSVTNPLCNGGTDGKIVISATGGTGAITYSISPAVGTQSPSGTFSNLTANTYTITAKDANNCTTTKTVTVTQPLAIDPNKCYTIINKKSGKVLDVFLGFTIGFVPVNQYTANGGNNQKWRFTSTGSGYVKIVAQNSGQVLSNLSGLWGTLCYQLGYFSGSGDWKLECQSNGYFKIIHRNYGKVLDVFAASTLNGIQTVTNDWTGGDSQLWQIVETTCPAQTYNLSNSNIADIDGHAELSRNVIDFTTNQGKTTDYWTAEKLNKTTGTFESLELRNNKETFNEAQHHIFYDNKPNEGENDYRIKQTAVTGDVAYSAIKTIVYKSSVGFGVYPNPANDVLTIDLAAYKNQAVEVYLYNYLGQQEVFNKIEKVTNTVIELDVATMQTGNYRLLVKSKGRRDAVKAVMITH